MKVYYHSRPLNGFFIDQLHKVDPRVRHVAFIVDDQRYGLVKFEFDSDGLHINSINGCIRTPLHWLYEMGETNFSLSQIVDISKAWATQHGYQFYDDNCRAFVDYTSRIMLSEQWGKSDTNICINSRVSHCVEAERNIIQGKFNTPHFIGYTSLNAVDRPPLKADFPYVHGFSISQFNKNVRDIYTPAKIIERVGITILGREAVNTLPTQALKWTIYGLTVLEGNGLRVPADIFASNMKSAAFGLRHLRLRFLWLDIGAAVVSAGAPLLLKPLEEKNKELTRFAMDSAYSQNQSGAMSAVMSAALQHDAMSAVIDAQKGILLVSGSKFLADSWTYISRNLTHLLVGPVVNQFNQSLDRVLNTNREHGEAVPDYFSAFTMGFLHQIALVLAKPPFQDKVSSDTPVSHVINETADSNISLQFYPRTSLQLYPLTRIQDAKLEGPISMREMILQGELPPRTIPGCAALSTLPKESDSNRVQITPAIFYVSGQPFLGISINHLNSFGPMNLGVGVEGDFSSLVNKCVWKLPYIVIYGRCYYVRMEGYKLQHVLDFEVYEDYSHTKQCGKSGTVHLKALSLGDPDNNPLIWKAIFKYAGEQILNNFKQDEEALYNKVNEGLSVNDFKTPIRLVEDFYNHQGMPTELQVKKDIIITYINESKDNHLRNHRIALCSTPEELHVLRQDPFYQSHIPVIDKNLKFMEGFSHYQKNISEALNEGDFQRARQYVHDFCAQCKDAIDTEKFKEHEIHYIDSCFEGRVQHLRNEKDFEGLELLSKSFNHPQSTIIHQECEAYRQAYDNLFASLKNCNQPLGVTNAIEVFNQQHADRLPLNTDRVLRYLAVDYLNIGDYEKSIFMLSQITQDTVELHYLKAMAYLRLAHEQTTETGSDNYRIGKQHGLSFIQEKFEVIKKLRLEALAVNKQESDVKEIEKNKLLDVERALVQDAILYEGREAALSRVLACLSYAPHDAGMLWHATLLTLDRKHTKQALAFSRHLALQNPDNPVFTHYYHSIRAYSNERFKLFLGDFGISVATMTLRWSLAYSQVDVKRQKLTMAGAHLTAIVLKGYLQYRCDAILRQLLSGNQDWNFSILQMAFSSLKVALDNIELLEDYELVYKENKKLQEMKSCIKVIKPHLNIIPDAILLVSFIGKCLSFSAGTLWLDGLIICGRAASWINEGTYEKRRENLVFLPENNFSYVAESALKIAPYVAAGACLVKEYPDIFLLPIVETLQTVMDGVTTLWLSGPLGMLGTGILITGSGYVIYRCVDSYLDYCDSTTIASNASVAEKRKDYLTAVDNYERLYHKNKDPGYLINAAIALNKYYNPQTENSEENRQVKISEDNSPSESSEAFKTQHLSILYDQFLSHAPDNIPLLLMKAKFFASQGQAEEAHKVLVQAEKSANSDLSKQYPVLLAKAEVLVFQQQFDESIKVLSQIEANVSSVASNFDTSKYFPVLLMKAEILASQRQFDESLKILSQIEANVSLDPVHQKTVKKTKDAIEGQWHKIQTHEVLRKRNAREKMIVGVVSQSVHTFFAVQHIAHTTVAQSHLIFAKHAKECTIMF